MIYYFRYKDDSAYQNHSKLQEDKKKMLNCEGVKFKSSHDLNGSVNKSIPGYTNGGFTMLGEDPTNG